MYQYSNAGSSSSGSHPKRRKKRPIHGVKTVAVTRGRSGYGFTISGQHPCVLSCIVTGSPADEAGLKAGDYLLCVNTENVSKAPHDDVVRMVGISTGTLTLQVAENYNSSDSSDEEYHHRSKARYPNRIRTRVPTGGNKDKVLCEFNSRDRHTSSDMKHKDPHAFKTDLPKSVISKPRPHAPVGSENSGTPKFAGPLSVERRPAATVASVHATPSIHHPLSKQAIVKGISQSARSVRHNPVGSSHSKRPGVNSQLNGSMTTASISSILKTSVNNTNSTANNAFIAMEEDDDDVEDEDEHMLIQNGIQDAQIVVGYIGSIEMPSDADKPHIRVQSIRNAVRRLRIEQKIHTLVLMQVSSDGVKLSNAMGTTVAHYPVDRLAFSGICPDDKRFFGIVTLHSTSSEEVGSDNGSQDESSSSGSCHVFMVDPEMRSHNIHADKAAAFGINCSLAGPERQNCSEFPRSATPIILAITNLYKNRQGSAFDNEVALSQAFADPTRAPQRSNSNSSNSDSGLGFSRDDATADRVLVVDMPPPADRPVRDRSLQATPRLCKSESSSSILHSSPDCLALPTPLRDSQRVKSVHADVKTKLNASVVSNDDFPFLRASGNSKFNIRAMPDPINSGFGAYSMSSDGLDRQSSADTLRASMHKVLKARHCSEHNSDQESTTSQGSDMMRCTSQPDLRRPVSAPPIKHVSEENFVRSKNRDGLVETVDMNDKRLSPRAFLPPPFHQLRSPSAPPAMNNSFEMEDMDTTANTSVMGSLIERFEQDHALRISSPANVSRRFSEGLNLTKQREKEKTTVDDGERWAKPHSVRHRKMSRLQQPLSHSHESLVAIENEVGGKRLSSAGSANNINSHQVDDLDDREEEEIGRIAGWSVNFEKLLKDLSGLAVFTEFLKKEFSEENIVFWRICEQFKSINDSDKRKSKAKEIFAKHISVKASDPVNIEHDARQQVEKQLDNPGKEIFDKPQLEIFKLMKQDSYPRFIKSELYKTYLMREMSAEPLCLPTDTFQGILGSKELKERKKASKGTEEKEKRRRSLLPWRQKSSKQSLKATSDSDLKKNKDKTPASTSSKEVNNNTTTTTTTTTTNKRTTPGPGIDLSTIRKEVQANTKEKATRESEEKNFKFCRVILPDGSTTVVCAKPGLTIRSVLGKLCDKRSLSIASVDVFLLGSDKPLDLTEDISTLGSREVMIERRVLFRMDLPNRKSIGVKAKPNRSVRDVFKPILNKYGFKLDNIWVQLSGQSGLVDIDAQVSSIDNQRVVIHQQEESNAVGKNSFEGRTTSRRPPLVVKYPFDYHIDSETTSLDVITNRIFDDLMKGKSELAHNFDELGILDPDSSQQVQLPRSSGDRPSLGLFGLRKKEGLSGKVAQAAPKGKNKHKVTFNLQKNQTCKAPSFPDDDRFLDLLSKVQGDRLDDQRGLNMKNSEIPEFLRNKSYPSGRESAPPVMSGQRTVNTVNNYLENDNAHFTSYTRAHISQRPSSVSLDAMTRKRHSLDSDEDSMNVNYGSLDPPIPHGNQSFSADGIIPSPKEAQEYFQSTALESPDFDDPCMAEKSVRDLGFDYSFNMYQAKAYGYSRHRPHKKHSQHQDLSPERDRIMVLDKTLTPTNPDFDDTLLASSSDLIISPVAGGHIRSNSVPVSHPSPSSETIVSTVLPPSDSKLAQKRSSDIVDAVNPVNLESPRRGSFTEGMINHTSAFHSPSSKVMTIDLDSECEENVTFV